MSVADDSFLAHSNYEALQDVLAAPFEESQQSRASGSFQVADSDNDESLEQLAEQQEQEYWSMLGDEGDEHVAVSAYASSSASSTPLVTSRRVRSRTPLVHNPDGPFSATESFLPSPLPFRRPTSHSQDSALQERPIVAFSPLLRSPSMSPDPLLLTRFDKGQSRLHKINLHTDLNPDEGYQTKTDSDHVTSLGDVSAEPEACFPNGQPADASTNSPLPFSSIPHNLPSPRAASPGQVGNPANDRLFSSPLSSPASSQAGRIVGIDEATRSPPSPSKSIRTGDEAKLPSRDASEATFDHGGAPARQLRQRKAVQLAPYSTEFSKFASLANKNSWEGVISAGLREAFLEKEREKAESQKRQRNPSDDWLVYGQEEEDDDDAEEDSSQSSSEPASPQKKHGNALSVNTGQGRHASTSVEKYSRSRKEKEWDPIANRLKAARKPSDVHPRIDRPSHASTSKLTIEDLERSAARRARKKAEKLSSSTKKLKTSKETDTAARAAQITEARKAGLLPSDVESSSSEHENKSVRKNQAKTHSRSSVHRSTTTSAAIIGSSDSQEPDSDGLARGESPDRPIDTRKDRFVLKGKRKRAAMFMMPAVALKKAEADLRLMEQEMAEGKQIRLKELEGHDPMNDVVPESVKAKKRWRPQNSNRPFRYVTELSSDDSDSSASRDTPQTDENDETQAAMHAWTNMAAGKSETHQESGNQYWDKMIGRILLRRDRNAITASTRRRRKPRKSSGSSSRTHQQSDRAGECKRNQLVRSRQSNLAQHFAAPVYLDTAERLFGNGRERPPLQRAPPRPKGNSAAFWKALAGSAATHPQSSEAISTQPAAIAAQKPSGASADSTTNDQEAAYQFARFSFDYDIGRLPAGLKFAASSYLSAGYLHEHLCHLKGKPTFSVQAPITPFGIGLDSAVSPEVLMQMLPRLIDCIYEHTIGETGPSNLHGSVNQALRFLAYYCLVWHNQNSDYALVRVAIFDQLSALEARLDKYVAEVDDVDPTLNSSMTAFKFAMFEIATLAYAMVHRHANPVAKESARHHILETMTDLVQTLLQSSPAKLAGKLRGLTTPGQSEDVQMLLEDVHCETWVCLINICTATQDIVDYAFLSRASFWNIVEHCLHESAIQQAMHPIVRGETASFVAMLLCSISQFSPSGISIADPQLPAQWSIICQALDNIKSQDFANAYNNMSSPNRTRISRYIWTIFARFLNMASRWEWPILEQGKLLGRLFDILDSRQLQDFSIDGEADFPAFLSNFTGKVPTKIGHEDTVFHLFLRILSQAALECSQRSDRKAPMMLARIAMRIMPMREYLPYPRHNTAGKSLDRSVLVNHCALLVVLAVIDPQTSDRRFAKLKTILDFAGSDARARQDYLKAIMFMGIAYKVRGIDLSPVLSWLTHTADYLCSSYGQSAKRRAALLATKRRSASISKDGQYHTTKARLLQAPTPAVSDVAIETEIQSVNRDMAETAVMEGLLLGAVQGIMLVLPEENASKTAKYPSLEYLNTAWTVQVLSSPMARDPVAGSQVLQCIQTFLQLRNEYLRETTQSQQGESQDEFGDMDFDYDDPALNAMLGVANSEPTADANIEKVPDATQLDRQFIELLKTSFSPRLYAILSDLSVTNSGRDSGVPDLPNKAGYMDNVTELWAMCAVALVQKNKRDWTYYMEAFGKESWQRFADLPGRWKIGCTFSCLMLTHDGRAYKANRNTLLQILFRRLAAPVLFPRDAQLLSLLLNADPSFILWQTLPFELDDLTNEYIVDLKDLTASRIAVLRAIFSTCQKIFARQIITLQSIERSSAAVCREQQVDDQLLYSYLAAILSSMRDFLDSLKTSKAADGKLREYAAYCRQIIFLMKEEIGGNYVTEHNIPALRLLAGVINGTSI